VSWKTHAFRREPSQVRLLGSHPGKRTISYYNWLTAGKFGESAVEFHLIACGEFHLIACGEFHLIACGLMGEPTAPVIGSGGATNMNS
jgi:hypothetical protein